MKLATVQAIGDLLAQDGVISGARLQVPARAYFVLVREVEPLCRYPHPVPAGFAGDIEIQTACGAIVVQARLGVG